MIDINKLVWNDWNKNHIAIHAVTFDEVEEVCKGQPIPSETYGGRVRLIGATKKGRMLTVILAPKGEGAYYTVTARPASRKERRLYQERLGGEQAA